MEPITAGFPAELTKAINQARAEEFVLEFISRCKPQRNQRLPIWDEMLENRLVTPRSYRYPSGDMTTFGVAGTPSYTRRRSLLKNPESHQIVETLKAKTAGLLLGDAGFVQALPVGREDWDGAETVSHLEEVSFTRPGNFRPMFEWFDDILTFGNGYIECGWELEYDTVLQRFAVRNSAGEVASRYGYAKRKVKDCMYLRTRDPYDIFRDPSASNFRDSLGVVIRGRVTAQQARDATLRDHRQWDKEEVEQAIKIGTRDFKAGWDENLKRNDMHMPPDDYGMMTCFEFWGTVPWKPDPEDGGEFYADGVRRRCITILNGRCVYDGPIQLLGGKIPIVEGVMNPLAGRPWGFTPLEAIRFIQDHQDTMLMLLQDAAIEAVRGGWLIQTGSNLNPQALERRRIGQSFQTTGNPETVMAPIPLNTNGYLQAAMAYDGGTNMMRQATGVSDVVQGIQTGGRRTAAEATELFRSAIGRADLMARVLETDALPILGGLVLDRWQQFIPDEGQLMRRVGEKQPFHVTFFDIDGDYDLEFVGSRQAMSRPQRALALKECIQTLISNPYIAAHVNWGALIGQYFEEGLQRRDFEKFMASEGEAVDQLRVLGLMNPGSGQPSPPRNGPPEAPGLSAAA